MATAEDVRRNPWPVTIAVMIATFMQALDTTIANVSLPHMQGSVSAASDQITWVLTSYIVATAIMTPLSGWMADRIGRKRMFLLSILLFTAASMLCGVASGLTEMVAFRFLQGLAGAAFIPLSQAELLDIHPPEKHGTAMAIWSGGAIVAPVLGPFIGGYLTEQFSWRWCFYINLPFGILAFLGVWIFMSDDGSSRARKFDFIGFIALSVFVTAFQLMLDRGPGLDWFASKEIWTEAALAAGGLWVFLVHSLSTSNPFFNPRLITDRNFLPAALFAFASTMLLYGVLALVPPLTQTLLGYPVITAGLVMMPRGLGSLVMMFFIGPLTARFDPRALLILGLGLTGFATWHMTKFELGMPTGPIIVAGVIQGVGMGFLFVPLAMLAFGTLPKELRPEGSSMFALLRNLGGSIGISLMQAQIAINAPTMHASMANRIDMADPLLRQGFPDAINPSTPEGMEGLNAFITKQSMMIAYLDVFWLMTAICVLCMPIALMLKRPRGAPPPPEETLHVD